MSNILAFLQSVKCKQDGEDPGEGSKFICDDFESPLQDLLQKNGVVPLHISRKKLMAREVYKIVQNIAPAYLHDLISLKPSTYDFRYEK